MEVEKIVALAILIALASGGVSGDPDYHDALSKSLLLFHGQRSGKLPPDQSLTWRANSGLTDGSAEKVDLTGGYYDAGDNVNPLGHRLPPQGLRPPSFRSYVQVGDPNADHDCWERPEGMSTPRSVFKVTPSAPGTEVAAETAAAIAAASLVFKHCSYSGFQDELLWGAAWLYKATRTSSYLSFAQSLGINYNSETFSWDSKIPGAAVLIARESVVDEKEAASGFRQQAERFVCNVLPKSPSVSVNYTPGGLLYMLNGSNMQYVTSTTFLLSTYAKYLKTSSQTMKCGDMVVTSLRLRKLVKRQVDYILGDNPSRMSYMVPQRIHHRGSSIPSFRLNSEAIGCDEGFQFYYDAKPNPNELTGAVVGGPDENDKFADDREDYSQSEPATYINAPLVGTLSYLAASFRP
ncbi:hypothetical protein OPV22_030312 [Ensete ventricosum]|uniref:Endoglucanase n=1 Tax=Ensete ventricosum TaxID=4639 RepID=A0AAV8PZV3_ENSVE|nr:hypothetical protein OPV22_030312 [Ensete ventricosum]